ncbi:Ig-like domain repeat protein, partial [Streptomyces sp. ME19-03-3]|nr:Ig-like domain repeat protein [Streptomyces sp. ME19-03-3]
GTVTFTGPGGLNQTVALNGSGQACFTSTTLTSGTITATYNGDTCAAGSAGTVTVTVNPATTTTSVTATPNPSVCGQSVTVCATVAINAPGTGTPTGTVTFTGPGGLNQTVALNGSGQACFTSTTLTSGTITATYNGDTCRAGSAGTVAVSVVPATSTTVLAVSPNPSVCGQPLTLTATVSVVPPGTGMPSGSVTFFDGPTPLGTAMVVGNTATLPVPLGLGAGTHSLLAVYSGNSCVASSAGSALPTVGKAGSTTVLTTSPNPSLTGQTVTMTATVSAAAPGGGTPTGTVTFFDGPTPIGTAPVVGGVATLTKSNFSVGVHTLTASYSGSTCHNPSTSAAVLQRVVSNTPPSLAYITPTIGPRAGGGNVLLVGSNLASVTSVTFGGVAGTLLTVTGSLVTVTAPPHAPGTVSLVAHSPAGSSNAVNYRYL